MTEKQGDSLMSDHTHEWTALWAHFGRYGDQDAHFHVCMAPTTEHPAPGYTADCKVMLVGAGRSCVDGQAHEVRPPPRRVRHG